MTSISTFIPLLSSPAALADLRKVVTTLDHALDAADAALKAELKAKEEAKKQRSPIDELEDKIMTTTAVAAAASGTPEQAKDMLAKARHKAMQAAADGVDTGALDAMVRQMEHLAKIAEENRLLKKDGRNNAADAIPVLSALNSPSV